ncbi:MAG TPA: hypothetical protein VJ892_00560 [Candidatus Absconditabacterales bacterium]|nr:hypothetical protein [Candidatus Absconditabacterales bacterium]
MNKHKYYNIKILAGLLLIFLGAIYDIFLETNLLLSLIFVVGGMVLVVTTTLKYNKFGAGIKKDERIKKLALVSGSYSWFITFLTINILFWINHLNIIELSTNAIISIIMFIMILSMGIFLFIFKNKPDYEN